MQDIEFPGNVSTWRDEGGKKNSINDFELKTEILFIHFQL